MKHELVRLWAEGEYRGAMDDGFEPTLDTYILDGDRPRPAVLICPGGGYGFRSPRESEPVALQFNAAGFHAFILQYSVSPRRHPLPFLDASRAMCLIRERAGEWRVRSNAVAICGFSAGGHLAAQLATGGLTPANALILCYPVITSGAFAHEGSIENLLGTGASMEARRAVSLEFAVGPQTPPSFIWHTFADQAVPLENSLLFVEALRKAGVPFELHVYPSGVHGLSLAQPESSDELHGVDPHIATWMGLCVQWLWGLFGGRG